MGKERTTHPLLTVAIVVVIAFASLQVTGSALADSGQLADCGAPQIFKEGGIGLSLATLWWLGEQVGTMQSMW